MRVGVLGLTGEQIRAARALARMEQAELASRTRLSLETIKRLERMRGVVEANRRTISAIGEAFEAMGIVFDSGEDGGVGVRRLPASGSRTLQQPPSPAPMAARRGRGEGSSALHRLVYYSTARPEVARSIKPVVDDIVAVAREHSAALGVTGALFASNGRFLQALEGSKEAVRQIYGAISSDPRHADLQVLENRSVASRMFQDWTLCCGLFRADDVLAHEPALNDGFRPEALSPASAIGLLSVVRELQAMPPRSGRAPGECPLASECLDRICAASAAHPV